MNDPIDTTPPPRQRGAWNDPAMRDGDSAHGNPYEPAGDEEALDSDSDIGDTATPEDERGGELPTGDTASPAGTTADPRTMPIGEYDRLTIPEVLERANGLSKDQLNEVASYERAHRNRKTLLAKLDRLIDSPDSGA